jgi:hypothetical protein
MLHEISAYDLLNSINETPEVPKPTEDAQDSNTLLAHATSIRQDMSPADIRKVLSSVKTPHKTKEKESCVTIDGKKYRQCNMLKTYHVSNHTRQKDISLVDRGANGGIAVNDVRRISTCSDKTVNVMGIDNHQLTSIPIITAGGVSTSHLGPVILIFNQYAHHGKGKSIHSPVQLESFLHEVNDRCIKLGGKNHIKTIDGYIFPLDFCDGLPYLPLRPYTDDEWDNLPHVLMTSDQDWDPTTFDNTISNNDKWYDAIFSLD